MIDFNKEKIKKRLPKSLALGATLFTLSLGVTVFFMTADYGMNLPAAEDGDAIDTIEETAGNENPGEEETGKSQKNPVIVIDAGHGGIDAGASAADGTSEKEINLSIAQKLKEIAESYSAEVVMTREGDMGLYSPENKTSRQREDLLHRKEVMADADATLAVSIHLNSFPGDSSVRGPQVFFPEEEGTQAEQKNNEQVGEHSSKEFAEAVQKSLEINLSDGEERQAAAKDDILLFQNPPCRIILVECGFLSNPEEADLLKSEEYQQKIGEAIWTGINEILGLEKKEEIPLVVSANKTNEIHK